MQQDTISAFRKNLHDLLEFMANAKRMPLSNTMCIVDRERIMSIAGALEADLPTAFAECEGVVNNQISIIAEANERAERTGAIGTVGFTSTRAPTSKSAAWRFSTTR